MPPYAPTYDLQGNVTEVGMVIRKCMELGIPIHQNTQFMKKQIEEAERDKYRKDLQVLAASSGLPTEGSGKWEQDLSPIVSTAPRWHQERFLRYLNFNNPLAIYLQFGLAESPVKSSSKQVLPSSGPRRKSQDVQTQERSTYKLSPAKKKPKVPDQGSHVRLKEDLDERASCYENPGSGGRGHIPELNPLADRTDQLRESSLATPLTEVAMPPVALREEEALDTQTGNCSERSNDDNNPHEIYIVESPPREKDEVEDMSFDTLVVSSVPATQAPESHGGPAPRSSPSSVGAQADITPSAWRHLSQLEVLATCHLFGVATRGRHEDRVERLAVYGSAKQTWAMLDNYLVKLERLRAMTTNSDTEHILEQINNEDEELHDHVVIGDDVDMDEN